MSNYPDNMSHHALDHDEAGERAFDRATEKVDAAIKSDFFNCALDHDMAAALFDTLAILLSRGKMTSGSDEDMLDVGREVCRMVTDFRTKRIAVEAEHDFLNR